MRRILFFLAIFTGLIVSSHAADIVMTSPDDKITVLPDTDDLKESLNVKDGLNVYIGNGGTFIMNNYDTNTTTTLPPTSQSATYGVVPHTHPSSDHIVPDVAEVMYVCGWSADQARVAIANLETLTSGWRRFFDFSWSIRASYTSCNMLSKGLAGF